MAGKRFGSMYLMQLVLGIALIVFGIMAVNGYNSAGQEVLRGLNKLMGKSGNLFPVAFGIIEIVAGVIITAALFVKFSRGLFRMAHLIICIFWAVGILLQFVLSGTFLKPDLLRWLGGITPQLVILLALWQIGDDF